MIQQQAKLLEELIGNVKKDAMSGLHTKSEKLRALKLYFTIRSVFVVAVQKNILEQYNSIKLEIKDLEQRIKDHEKQIKLLESETVCDVVKGSKADLRYGTIRVEGIAQQEIDRHWNLIHKKMEQLQSFKKKLEEMAYEVETYIESIDDCTVRMIARFRYLDGNTWEKTARCMGIYYTGDYCRLAFSRYFKKECKEIIE